MMKKMKTRNKMKMKRMSPLLKKSNLKVPPNHKEVNKINPRVDNNNKTTDHKEVNKEVNTKISTTEVKTNTKISIKEATITTKIKVDITEDKRTTTTSIRVVNHSITNTKVATTSISPTENHSINSKSTDLCM